MDGPTSHRHFDAFSRRELAAVSGERLTYELRKEQQEAVSMTRAYFENGGEEFL